MRVSLPMLLVLCVVLGVGLALVDARPAAAHGLLVAAPPEGGPVTPVAPVRLTSHHVAATIDGPVASVTVEQVFLNRTASDLEGTWLFPLPEGASVSGFAMTMGGRMVEGEVLDAAEAKAIYEGIVRRRRDPGLLEYVGRGLYRARVFPIPANGEVRVKLTFQQVLPEHDATLEWRYPLATDRLHGESVDEVVVTAAIRGDRDVKAVYSPSHELAVDRQGDREVLASYESSQHRQARDFLLYVGRADEGVGVSLLSQRGVGDDGTFLAILAPKFDRGDLPVVPKDVIFVLDTSGSMREQGKIDQAKRALAYGISLLRPEDRFGVVTFAAAVRSLGTRLAAANPLAKAHARTWMRQQSADGGTNIEGGLNTALALADPERLAILVFLTDGLPTVGERNVSKLVKGVLAANHANARIFTFGVGHDLDVNLLDKIAEATKGARDYVQPEEELEIATSRFFRKVVEPALTDVVLDLGGDVHDVYPSTLPDLFAGGQIVVMGRYEQPGERVVRLKGRLAGREVEYVVSARLVESDGVPHLPRLWAHRKIAFLLDAIRLHGEDKELVDEIIRLGVRHAIVTPYTSGLVVEDGEDALPNANPLRRSTPPPPPPPRAGGGSHGGQYRGPGNSVPPGVREPTDATPPPPPPPTAPTTPSPVTPGTPGPANPAGSRPTYRGPARGPAASPVPPRAVDASKRLAREKERSAATDETNVRVVGTRTFRKDADGRWVDTAWDGTQATVKVEAFSSAWSDLLAKGADIGKVLALGEKIVFVLGDAVYEVVPAAP